MTSTHAFHAPNQAWAHAPTQAWADDNRARIQAMKTFRSVLMDRETVSLANADDRVFHDILVDAERRGYVHYTRLAAAMSLDDSSNVSRWFKRKVAPDRFRRAFALSALEKILLNDIQRLEAKCPKAPIGHLSMKDYPVLEVDVVEMVA